MTRAILVLLFALSSISSVFAQGTVNIRATDPSTARSVQVGDQTNNAIRIRIVASDPTIAISASSLPLPTGAATSAAQTTGNASLASIDGKLAALVSGRVPVDGSGVTQPISASALPLPSGAATSANQTTEITALQLIDDPVATLGTTTYTEGSTKAFVIGGVRRDANTTMGDTNNEVVPLSFDANGNLKVAIIAGAGSGGTAMADDAAFTVGTTNVTPVGGTYKSTRDAVDDNDGGAFAMTAKRAAYVSLETPLAVSAMDETAGAVKALLVTAAGAALTQDTQFTHDTALGTITSVTGGATFYRASTATTTAVSADDDAVLGWADRNGRLHITGDASMGKLLVTPDANSAVNIAQVNGGTVAAGSGAANTNTLRTVAATDSTLFGSGTAHDAADAGNPHKIGARATTSLSGVTLVSDADRTNLYAGVDGVIITRPYTNLEDIVKGNASNTDGSSFEIIATAGAGIKQYLTSVSCSNSSTTGIYVEIKSGTTVMYTLPVPAAAASDVNGVTKEFVVPLPPNAANEAWNIDGSAAVTTLRCSMIGFRSKI